jgi:S1-C subfamily serine protease
MKSKILITTFIAFLALSMAACSSLPATQTNTQTTVPSSPTSAAPTNNTAAPAQLASPSLESLQQAYENVYQTVLPSVVSIEVTIPASSSSVTLQNLPAPFNSPNGNIPNDGITYALGSGFVWDTMGDIVTNNHLVDGASSITVIFSDGTKKSAKIVGQDVDSDLAAIKVDSAPAQLTSIQVGDSTQVKVGQIAIAIGNPLGLENTMTVGIVSALGRSLPVNSSTQAGDATYTIPDVIQTDAPINHGNSGGVLVDINSKLIGVTTAIESSSGGGSIGLGYVIPSIIVQKVVPSLISKGSYQHPMLGLTGTTMTDAIAAAMNLNAGQHGALVIKTAAGSPVEKAGILGGTKEVTIDTNQIQVGGDIIVKIDNTPVNNFEDLTTYLARYTDVGQTVKLTVLRQGKQMEFNVTLAVRTANTSASTAQIPQRSNTTGQAFLGMQGMGLTSEIISAMKLPEGTQGVLVEQVTTGGPADQAGLLGSFKPLTINGQQIMIGGDVITKVDALPITGMQQFVTVINSYDVGKTIKLEIIRDGKTQTLDVTLGQRPAQ